MSIKLVLTPESVVGVEISKYSSTVLGVVTVSKSRPYLK